MKGVPVVSDEHMSLLIELRNIRNAVEEAKCALVDSNIDREDMPYDVVHDWFDIIMMAFREFSITDDRGA